MPRITPKSPELLVAQVAAFTDETIEHLEDRSALYNKMGSLVVASEDEIVRVIEGDEHHWRGDKPYVLHEGTEHLVATSKDYSDFLRQAGGMKYEPIQRRANLIDAYHEFEPVVDAVEMGVGSAGEGPVVLGEGSFSRTFSITHEGKKYAARVLNETADKPKAVDNHVAASLLVKGKPHFEQLVAASYEAGVTIAEVLPGDPLSKISARELHLIGNEELSQLVETVIDGNEYGIVLDHDAGNFLYDKKEGFGLIDFQSSQSARRFNYETIEEAIGGLGRVFVRAGIDNQRNFKDLASYSELYEAKLDVLERLGPIIGERLAGEEMMWALSRIDEAIGAVIHQANAYRLNK